MFTKKKSYKRTLFPPAVFEEVIAEYNRVIEQIGKESGGVTITYTVGNEETGVKNPDEYQRNVGFLAPTFYFYANDKTSNVNLVITKNQYYTDVTVRDFPDLAQA